MCGIYTGSDQSRQPPENKTNAATQSSLCQIDLLYLAEKWRSITAEMKCTAWSCRG